MLIPFIHNQRGIALFNIVFVLIFIGVLAVGGVKMYGSVVERGKINASKGELENHVKVITAWAIQNGRLPTAAEYPAVFGGTAPVDNWGRQIAYVYDNTLTAAITGGLCGRTATIFQDSGVPIAFALVSGGNDAGIQTTVNGTVVAVPTNAVTGAAPQSLANNQTDLYRTVPLEEMKSKAGCYGPTGGRLNIINNELPNVCSGSSTYTATLFASGGVGGYTWALVSPPWLAVNPATGVLSPNTSITGTAGTYPVTVSLTDSHTPSANTVQRTYSLKVLSCGPAPPGTITNPVHFNSPSDPTAVTDNWNGGTANDQGTNNTGSPSGRFDMTITDGTLSAISVNNGTTSSCIWYQRPLTLTGKKMRAYFQFVYQSGDGFVLAMVPSLGQSTISSCDENAYMGFGSDIPGNTLIGAQFQVNDRNDGTGPGSTCISTTANTCSATYPGIDNWATGTTIYYVRAELDATVTPNPTYKVWLSSNSSYKSAFQNLSTAYSGTLIPVTKTVTSTNISDLSSFFLGFTTGQHGNNNVNMVASDLKFVLN